MFQFVFIGELFFYCLYFVVFGGVVVIGEIMNVGFMGEMGGGFGDFVVQIGVYVKCLSLFDKVLGGVGVLGQGFDFVFVVIDVQCFVFQY